MTEVSHRPLDVDAGRAADEAEVRACFDAYEAALIDGDVDTMNTWFADNARTIRFGVAEEQTGAEQIRAWRRTAERVPPGRALTDTEVVGWAPGVAVVTTLFRYPGTGALGRQSQTWVRMPDGWRIVHAHVSERRP